MIKKLVNCFIVALLLLHASTSFISVLANETPLSSEENVQTLEHTVSNDDEGEMNNSGGEDSNEEKVSLDFGGDILLGDENVDQGEVAIIEETEENVEEYGEISVSLSNKMNIIPLNTTPLANAVIETFTGSTVWTVPTGVSSVEVFAVGGGGGGAGDGPRANAYALGGAGGQVVSQTIPVNPGENITITIGQGGRGGGQQRCSYDSGGPVAGGTTSFGTYLTALGGAAAPQRNLGNGYCSSGISGGPVGGSAGTDGVLCVFCNTNDKYGAGGAAGCNSYGSTCSGGSGGNTGGGNGGGGANNFPTNRGYDATFYGGGGGGAAFSSNHTYSQGGNGYQGIVIIRYQIGGFTVSYSPTTPTTGNVIATVTAIESGNFTFTDPMGRSSNDGGISYHKNYSNNLTGEIVRFINGSGDVFERSINITWILPEISIAYSPNGPHFTSGAVVASISFNKPGITITNNGGNANYTFNKNGSFTFEWADTYGNRGETIATVDWIGDGLAIVPTVNYSPAGPTLTVKNVVATISFNKSGVLITNTNYSPCQGGEIEVKQGKCTFTKNGTFSFEYADFYNVTGSTIVEVNWIEEVGGDYGQTGSCQTFTPSHTGDYLLQVRGAQGGYSANPKGKGGYAKGTITLSAGETLYICVGGQPTDCDVGGYNGGGPSYQSSTNDSCGGGGGTDIRVGKNSLYARVIVAGGGGAGYSTNGANNYAGRQGNLSSQPDGRQDGSYICNSTNSFMNGSFGIGGGNPFGNPANLSDDYGGGGGGRYGGSSCGDSYGGGGSNYVLTNTSHKPVGYLLGSEYYLTGALTIAGNASMPTYDGLSTMVGNAGNGYAKITLVDKYPEILNLTYTPNGPVQTTGIVEVSITFDEEVILSESGRTTIDNSTFTKTFSINTGYTLGFSDSSNKTGSVDLLIDWIIPTAKVEYNTTSTTAELVILTLNKTGTILDTKWTCASATPLPNITSCETYLGETVGRVWQNTYNADTTEKVIFKDTSGATGNVIIEVVMPILTTPSLPSKGGSVILHPDNCPNGDFSPSYYDGVCYSEDDHNSAEDKEDTLPPYQGDTSEGGGGLQELYNRAKKFGLTTMPTLEQARMSDTITRAEMAKIVVSYINSSLYNDSSLRGAEGDKAIQTEAEQPVDSSLPLRSAQNDEKTARNDKCEAFTDLNQVNAELQSYIIKACEFGLMGYYSDGETLKDKFSPEEMITKAEIATVISRMLRGSANNGAEQWRYQNHLLALRKEEIIRQDIDPMTKETRGNVFIMLSRI